MSKYSFNLNVRVTSYNSLMKDRLDDVITVNDSDEESFLTAIRQYNFNLLLQFLSDNKISQLEYFTESKLAFKDNSVYELTFNYCENEYNVEVEITSNMVMHPVNLSPIQKDLELRPFN